MNIIVCVKSVLLEAPEDGGGRPLDLSDLNPFDRPALALAARLRGDDGRVTALSMCSAAAGEDALLMAMALGADCGVLLCDEALAGGDTLATSRALAAAIDKLGPCDLVLFGSRTLDSDTGHVGPQTAELLGVPYVGLVSKVEASGAGLTVDREADGYHERYEVSTPAALSVLPKAAPVVDAPLFGIEESYAKSEYEILTVAELGLAEEEVGLAGSPTRVGKTSRVERERKCELIEGTVEEQAEGLVKRLVDDGVIR